MPRRALWGLVVLAHCGGATPPAGTSPPPSAQVRAVSDRPSPGTEAFAEGILDVGADELRAASEKARTPETRLAYARALADAWAFEKARAQLSQLVADVSASASVRDAATASLAGLPVGELTASEPDADVIGRALHGLATHDAKSAVNTLEPLATPRAAPLVLELLGRARLALGEGVEARKLFARARSRIDAAGDRIGVLPTAAGAVAALEWQSGELLVVRARERYLVGGYQSSGTHSMWVERYAPGEREPLVRWTVGNPAGATLEPDGKTLALIDWPIDESIGPPKQTARLFDDRTGLQLASWPMNEAHIMGLGPVPGSLLVSGDKGVDTYDGGGHAGRSFPLSGTTQGMIYAYGVNGCKAIPTTFASRPVSAVSSSDGTVALGASDGAIWVWRHGSKMPSVLQAWKTSSRDANDGADRVPVTMRLDPAGDRLVVVHGDGSIVEWDLDSRAHRFVGQGACTVEELARTGFGELATPDSLARCGHTSRAALSPDGSRAVIAGMGGVRVHDAHSGAPLAILDTLASEAMTFEDGSGAGAWLGAVDGTIERWDTAGKRSGFLAQGGASGFLRGISGDGRFVAVTDAEQGFRTTTKPATSLWDTATTGGQPVPGLEGLVDAIFAAEAPEMLAIRRRDDKTSTFELWDLSGPRRVGTIDAGTEWYFHFSADGTRLVSITQTGKLAVREQGRVTRTLDAPDLSELTIDRGAHTAAAHSSAGEVVVWNLDEGSVLLRKTFANASGLSLSPAGHRLAVDLGPDGVSVLSLPDGREIARLTPKDISVDEASTPLRGCTLVTDDEALCSGPGAPGYSRIARWTVGVKTEPTELQVLEGARIELLSSSVAAVYDRNDSVNLVRTADGVLLAGVHATLGGGWIAMTPAGAVDSSPGGQSAAVTFVEGGHARTGQSSWLAWDRFAVPGLLQRAATGEIVAPPMAAGLLERSDSLRGQTSPP